MKDKIKKIISELLSIKIEELNKDFGKVNENYTKEKIFIYKNYYDFIENDECLNFINDCFKNLEKFMIKDMNENDYITLFIIVLKSFLDKKNIINCHEEFVNSDEIFNEITDQFTKYLILNDRNNTSDEYLKYSKFSINDEDEKETEKKIQQKVLWTIHLLSETNLLKIKKINILGLNKTPTYYALKNISYTKKIESFFIFSYTEFELFLWAKKAYITTFHYSKTFEVNKKNFWSNKSFEFKNLEYLNKKINLKLYVDKEFQEDLRKNMNIDKNEIFNEMVTKIKELNKKYEVKNWDVNTKAKISEIQSNVAGLLEKLIISFFSEFDFFDNYVIFPMFTDFRGRKYYWSKIGPTSSKKVRLSYYYGYYDQEDFNEKNNKYSIKYYELIEDFCKKNEICSHKKFYETIYWCLIGIGKNLINKNKFPINEEEFIINGISFFEKKIFIKKEEDLLEINHYIRILKSLNTESKIKKRAIIKDATASINQIFMKNLGPLNQDSLNFVNLGNKNQWFDTYIVHREMFFKEISKENKKIEKKEFDEIFERRLIKKTIMTIPYSAGLKLCWKNYLEEYRKEKKEIKDLKLTKKLFTKFYNFTKEEMQLQYLYKKSTQDLIKEINKDFEESRKYVQESETGVADMSYFLMKKSSLEKKYKIDGINKRITKLLWLPSEAIDIESFNIASGANTAHFWDADEVRTLETLLGYSIITIHDCYLIDFNNCTNLINVKLRHYSEHIKKFDASYDITNVFILL